jgi:lipid-binding SYLF domain-containing protein
MRTLTFAGILTLSFVLSLAGTARAQSDQADRVRESATVLHEVMNVSDKAIPSSVLSKAVAIAVFPSTIKGAFLVGAQRGRGVISVRKADGTWAPPAFLTLTGGSFGLQIGGQAADIVLVVNNQRGLENLLRNQFTIGGEASATAGPVGRDATAATDIQLRAEILSYSRSRGLFAGISLKGAAIKEDEDSNNAFYGARFRSRDIALDGKATKPQAPDAVEALNSALDKYAK